VKGGLLLDGSDVAALLLLSGPNVGHEGIEIPKSGVSW